MEVIKYGIRNQLSNKLMTYNTHSTHGECDKHGNAILCNEYYIEFSDTMNGTLFLVDDRDMAESVLSKPVSEPWYENCDRIEWSHGMYTNINNYEVVEVKLTF